MSYTFGASDFDDISGTLAQIGASATACLVGGWYYPTTLTAGRGYWSAGNFTGAEVAPTTSEIRIKSDNVTTDGVWDTSGAGVATNQWHFMMLMGSFLSTGPAVDWRAWLGIGLDPPQEISLTQVTAPAGNCSGSTSMICGSKGPSSALAFQGEVGQMWWLRCTTSTTAASRSLIPSATGGVITAEEAQYVYETMVLPMWRNEYPERVFFRMQQNNVASCMLYSSLNGPNPCERTIADINAAGSWGGDVLTLSGVTLSGNRCPRPDILVAQTRTASHAALRRRL